MCDEGRDDDVGRPARVERPSRLHVELVAPGDGVPPLGATRLEFREEGARKRLPRRIALQPMKPRVGACDQGQRFAVAVRRYAQEWPQVDWAPLADLDDELPRRGVARKKAGRREAFSES